MATKLDLKVSSKADEAWHKAIANCGGNVYHDPRWVGISVSRGGTPLYFRWLDGKGQTAAIAAGRLRNSNLPFVGKWNAVLDLGSTPAIHPDYQQESGQVLQTLRREALALGCKRLSLESHMGQAIYTGAADSGFVETPRIEFRISLQDEESAIWSRISKHHKRKIRKAGRGDIRIEDVDTEDAIWSLRALQKGSQSRRQARGENMRLGDDEPVVAQMQKLLSQKLGKLFLAKVDDTVVSGALISFYDNRAYYVFGGSSPQGFSLNAPALLFWEVLLACKSIGGEEFNLGGVPAAGENENSQAHGLYRFKAGFGGQAERLSDLSANLRPVISYTTGVAAKLLRRG